MGRLASVAAPYLVASLGLGCSEPSERVAGVQQPVVGGALSGPERDASVMVVYDVDPATPGVFYLGSGVLVAPNLLLTARHNIVDSSPPGFDIANYSCGTNGEPVDLGLGGGYVVASGEPTQVKVYVGNVVQDPIGEPTARGVKIFDDGTPALCSHDIAFVLLDREIENVPPVQLRWSTPPTVGELITLVAWGMTDGGETVYQPRSHYLSGLPIIAVGAEQPDGSTSGPMARGFVTGPAGCRGDSGGGAFDEQGLLLGIETFYFGVFNPDAPDPCAVSTNETLYIQLASFHSLIEEAFTAAGQVPWLEGSPQPGTVVLGEACTADHDCESGVCGIEEGERGSCATACTSDADCDPSQECHLEGGFCGAPVIDAEENSCTFAAAPRKPSLWWWFALALYWQRRRTTSACRGRGGEGSRSARGG